MANAHGAAQDASHSSEDRELHRQCVKDDVFSDDDDYQRYLDDAYSDEDENDGSSRISQLEEKPDSCTCCELLIDVVAYCCCEPGDRDGAASLVAGFGIIAITFVVMGVLIAAIGGGDRVVHNDAGILISKAVRKHARAPQLVDVVYTWVNGSQPEFQRTLLAADVSSTLPYRPHASRFRDDGLLQFALRSLLQSDALMRSVRHVYIVSSGEVPWFLRDELRPLVNGSAAECGGAARGFTYVPLAMPLSPLVARARQGYGAGGRIGGGSASRLFVVPHSAIFPNPAADLPTFNSNGILCSLHRLPQLSDWFLYSDDDTIITRRNTSLDAWWDSRSGAQRLYFTAGHGINRRRRRVGNNWEEAMTFMSGLLDEDEPREVASSSASSGPPPPPSPSPTPLPPASPPPSPFVCPPAATALPLGRASSDSISIGSAGVAPYVDFLPPTLVPSAAAPPHARPMAGEGTASVRRWHQLSADRGRQRRGRLRYYARPQHMPVLLSRDLVREIEKRWTAEFEATRANRVRLGQEIELNFFYHHFLRVEGFPVVPMGSKRVKFTYAQRCAKLDGEVRCAKLLTGHAADFATFNDDATSKRELDAGLASLHRLLRARYGAFD